MKPLTKTSTYSTNSSTSAKTSSSSGKPTTPTPATTSKAVISPTPGSKEFRESFLKKLQICGNHLDFNDDTKDLKEKQERLNYLQELNELLNDSKNVTNVILPHLDLVMEMIEKNIFRPLPIIKKTGTPAENGVEEDDAIVDPAWIHLQPVYDFFHQLIIHDSAEIRQLKVYITHTFIQAFLELFDSEEPREREYLKTIFHKLYAKLVPRRKMMRKAMTDCLYLLIHESFKFNGASELLDILASIISGFAVPLREEHVYFFRTVIIPLHKVQTFQLYHEQLLRCSMLFLSKDPSMAVLLVEGLLRYWPFANSLKETYFLTELLEVLEICDVTKLDPLIQKLFKRLIKCIAGSHLQVADKAMCFFENDYFISILKAYKAQTFPLLVPVICAIADTHWHKVLQESLKALKSILKEIDSNAFDKAFSNKDAKSLSLIQDTKTQKKERTKVDERWKALTKLAALKNPNFKEPIVPYIETHMVGLLNGLNNGHIYMIC